MSLSAYLKKEFLTAAKDSPELQKPVELSIEKETLKQIMEPVAAHIKNDVVLGETYDQPHLCDQLIELRRMCSEAQVTQKVDSPKEREDRNTLTNTLQGVMESVEDAQGSPFIMLDKDDLFNLPRLTDVLRNEAAVYREFMHSESVASVLDNVANNIDQAQKRLWRPEVRDERAHFAQFTAGVQAANDADFEASANEDTLEDNVKQPEPDAPHVA